MKINRMIMFGLTMIFAGITMCLCVLSILKYYVNIDMIMISAVFLQLFSGLHQISIGQNIDLKEEGKGKNNKRVGIFSLIGGGVIITLFIVDKVV